MLQKDFYEKFVRTLVIVISPHPDDSVLGAGGLIHRLTDHVAWERCCKAPREDWPVVYTIVMTPGARGVDDEYLRRYAMKRLNAQNPALVEYLMLKMSGGETKPDLERELSAVREDIRRQESTAEARILRVKESIFAGLEGIYHDHTITSEDRAKFSEIVTRLLADYDGWHRLILVPHRDDAHPVHKMSTELACDLAEQELLWKDTSIWQYESPWITFTPSQIDTVITLDGIGMATKAEAMAVHRSQEYRTKYSDVARYRAQMKAETLPELLGGFGSADSTWDYVETFQVLHPVAVLGLPEE